MKNSLKEQVLFGCSLVSKLRHQWKNQVRFYTYKGELCFSASDFNVTTLTYTGLTTSDTLDIVTDGSILKEVLKLTSVPIFEIKDGFLYVNNVQVQGQETDARYMTFDLDMFSAAIPAVFGNQSIACIRKAAAFCAKSGSMSNPVFSFIRITENRVFGSDTHIAYCAEHAANVLDPLLIPAIAEKVLVDDKMEVYKVQSESGKENRYLLKTGKTLINWRENCLNYPNFNRVIPTDNTNECTLVIDSTYKGFLKLAKIKATAAGTKSVLMQTVFCDALAEIRFNPKYLENIFKVFSGLKITYSDKSPIAPALFSAGSELIVLTPMRRD